MRTVLWILAGIWAVALGWWWAWVHAATRDDEATEISDYFDYCDALDDDPQDAA